LASPRFWTSADGGGAATGVPEPDPEPEPADEPTASKDDAPRGASPAEVKRAVERAAAEAELRGRRQTRALVTGDVIGQVASQTLDNMVVIDQAAQIPVFRPLVGMDKEEITAEAIRLGTYPISIIPDQDCCTLFTPRHPATRARRDDVARAEEGLPIDEIVEQAAAAASVELFTFPR